MAAIASIDGDPETWTFAMARRIRFADEWCNHEDIGTGVEFIRSTRLLAKHVNGYQSAAERALNREDVARQIWNYLECHSGVGCDEITRSTGTGAVFVPDILLTWEQLGILFRVGEQDRIKYFLRSSLDAEVEGICYGCGVRGKGRKELFYKPTRCKACGREGHYHIKFSGD